MNTYQMHTLALLFRHVLTPTVIPLTLLSEFEIFFVPVSPTPSASSAHFLTSFLMVRHTDVTHPALLYNLLLYMYSVCMWLCTF